MNTIIAIILMAVYAIVFAVTEAMQVTRQTTLTVCAVMIILSFLLKNQIRAAAVHINIYLESRINRKMYFEKNPQCKACEHSKNLSFHTEHPIKPRCCYDCTKQQPEE